MSTPLPGLVVAPPDPAAPENRFRTAFAELTTALDATPLPQAAALPPNVVARLECCLALCHERAWPLLAATVHQAVAEACLRQRHYVAARQHYAHLRTQTDVVLAAPAPASGHWVAAQTLHVVAWLGEGLTYALEKNRAAALIAYGRAADLAGRIGAWALAIDAAGRVAQLHQQLGQRRLACQAYARAFDSARQLPLGQRPVALLTNWGSHYVALHDTVPERRAATDRVRSLTT